jgi:hypothetical protein
MTMLATAVALGTRSHLVAVVCREHRSCGLAVAAAGRWVILCLVWILAVSIGLLRWTPHTGLPSIQPAEAVRH